MAYDRHIQLLRNGNPYGNHDAAVTAMKSSALSTTFGDGEIILARYMAYLAWNADSGKYVEEEKTTGHDYVLVDVVPDTLTSGYEYIYIIRALLGAVTEHDTDPTADLNDDTITGHTMHIFENSDEISKYLENFNLTSSNGSITITDLTQGKDVIVNLLTNGGLAMDSSASDSGLYVKVSDSSDVANAGVAGWLKKDDSGNLTTGKVYITANDGSMTITPDTTNSAIKLNVKVDEDGGIGVDNTNGLYINANDTSASLKVAGMVTINSNGELVTTKKEIKADTGIAVSDTSGTTGTGDIKFVGVVNPTYNTGTEDTSIPAANVLRVNTDGFYSRFSLKKLSTTSSTNIKEEYQLVDATGTGFGATIPVYKDSSLYKVYLGSTTDALTYGWTNDGTSVFTTSKTPSAGDAVYDVDGNVSSYTVTSTSDGTIVVNDVTYTYDESIAGHTKGGGDDALCFIYLKSDGSFELVAIDISSFISETEFSNGLVVSNHVVSARLTANGGLEFDSGTEGSKGIQVSTATHTLKGGVLLWTTADGAVAYNSTDDTYVPTLGTMADFVVPDIVTNSDAAPSITVAENTTYKCTYAGGITGLTIDMDSATYTRESIIYLTVGSSDVTVSVTNQPDGCIVYGDTVLKAGQSYIVSVKDGNVTIGPANESELSLTTSGSGNVITDMTVSDHSITITKGFSAATADHSHGNIANDGTITTTAVDVASGDYLLFSDTSNGGKVERGIAIGSTVSTQVQGDGGSNEGTKFLREDGTWSRPSYAYFASYVQGVNANDMITVATGTSSEAITLSNVWDCGFYD